MTERPLNDAHQVLALRQTWRRRVAADARLDGDAGGLFTEEGESLDAVVAAVVAVAFGGGGAERGAVESARAAFATGRAAHARQIDLIGLQRLLGHLHDALSGQLIRRSAEPDDSLSGSRAEGIARAARAAMERPIVEATRGWFDEAGRKLRHDVKTPLQATSLNLELLTLESGERGLDTAALDTIQHSLDQVVEMLARAEPASG